MVNHLHLPSSVVWLRFQIRYPIFAGDDCFQHMFRVGNFPQRMSRKGVYQIGTTHLRLFKIIVMKFVDRARHFYYNTRVFF